MAKSFKVQQKPTFKMPVEIPIVGGDPMRVTFTFKTFDRRGLAALYDGWKKEGQALIDGMKKAAEDGEPWSLEELTDREIKLQVAQLKQIVEGWGFTDEFNDENIEALVETAVSVTEAIINQYHEGYQQARKGN